MFSILKNRIIANSSDTRQEILIWKTNYSEISGRNSQIRNKSKNEWLGGKE